MPGSFVSDWELNDWINDSGEDLYEMLVQKHEAYFESEQALALVSGTSDYALPTDFLKLLNVQLQDSNGEWYNLQRYNASDEDWASQSTLWDSAARERLKYQLRGTVTRFVPAPQQSLTARLLYIPEYTALVEESDALDQRLRPYSRWLIADCAIKCREKEQEDVSSLMAERARIEAKIESTSRDRDSAAPPRIVDARGVVSRAGFGDEW